jgi:predicted membrane-bound spermidine synthase
MLNSDMIKLNSILTSINQNGLSITEVNSIDAIYNIYGTEKDYWDAIVNIVLPVRNATNTIYRLFYTKAKENNIDYTTEKVVQSDIFIIGGSNRR